MSAEAVVDLTIVDLDRGEEQVLEHRALLSSDELTRADRFVFPKDRRKFTLARGALRKVLGARLGVPPAGLRFRYEEHGKPVLLDHPLVFNLSHSGERAVIAISSGPRVGVDVELARADLDHAGVARYTYSPTEVAAYFALPPELKVRGFFRCWTSKEAFVKTLGLGFSFPLHDFDVEVDPRRPGGILALRAPGLRREEFSLSTLEDDPAHPIALVTESPSHRLGSLSRL